MRLDVHFGVQQLTPQDMQGRVVAVIDVLRASTTIATALSNGARAVIPFESSEEAVTRSKQLERGAFLLAGERKMLRMEGFDLGNSPLEYTASAVEGKTVLLATTNGTRALLAVQGARDVVVASYVNLTGVSSMLRAALRGGADISIICAGQERQFALEDAACAGRLVQNVTRRLSGVEQIGSPIHFSETPVRQWRAGPGLGEHTTEVVRALGRSEGEIEELKSKGVLGGA